MLQSSSNMLLPVCHATHVWFAATLPPLGTLQGRLRANAEAVAFYRGVAKEGELLRSSFRDVVQHQARVLGKQWRFGMVQVGRHKRAGAGW